MVVDVQPAVHALLEEGETAIDIDSVSQNSRLRCCYHSFLLDVGMLLQLPTPGDELLPQQLMFAREMLLDKFFYFKNSCLLLASCCSSPFCLCV